MAYGVLKAILKKIIDDIYHTIYFRSLFMMLIGRKFNEAHWNSYAYVCSLNWPALVQVMAYRLFDVYMRQYANHRWLR